MILFLAVAATAQTTNGLSDAEIQGRQLARQLCDSQPAENFTNTGVLQIRDATGKSSEIPFKGEVIVTANGWCNYYEAHLPNGLFEKLFITHSSNSTNEYSHEESAASGRDSVDDQSAVLSVETSAPFAGSDFWIGDLGLEFFHWPEQKILPNPTSLCRGRAYKLLESTNPNPSASGYSRVDSWIDLETGGILQAEAYDAGGKLLKIFEPKSFKKVNGQWELQGVEIRNVQTGSRTQIDFDLKTQ